MVVAMTAAAGTKGCGGDRLGGITGVVSAAATAIEKVWRGWGMVEKVGMFV